MDRTSNLCPLHQLIIRSTKHSNIVLINPEVRKTLIKLPGYLLYILLHFIVYIKSEIWGVSGYWSKTHYKPKGTKVGGRNT
jgi:hypothetical protein